MRSTPITIAGLTLLGAGIATGLATFAYTVVNGVTVTAPDPRCVREGEETHPQLEWRKTGRLVVILDGTPRTMPATQAVDLATTGRRITAVWTCPP